ncbi:MAG: TonB-dependent receptor [Bacteroidota bacterium]
MKPTVIIFFLFLSISVFSQNTQHIRGVIIDTESEMTLPGATVSVLDSDPLIGTSCDMNGNFKLTNVQVGRIDLFIQMMGYEDQILQQVLLTSGKELYLTIKLQPSLQQLDEIVIEAKQNNQNALNEMATVSARSFSVEETQRYAASAFDPGRMALAFPGVNTAGDDLMNEISVRGNSPRGILWRMEGIQIPNPNHFGSLGSSGGGISMLSSSTLSTSDFYTGAFPAEFGNATAGVFDLNLRNGNNQKREHSLMFGALGLEASTEGFFKKNSNSSYLINYRYSTFALLSTVYNPIGDVLPTYSDLSFKLNFPNTSIGAISVFGLAGSNIADEAAEMDSTSTDFEAETESFRSNQELAVIGVKNVIRLNNKAFIKNVAAFSLNRYEDESYDFNLNVSDAGDLYDLTTFKDDQIAFNSSLTYKINAQNTLKTGFNIAQNHFDLIYDNKDLDTDIWTNYVNNKGDMTVFDAFAQWKNRISEKSTLNLGMHATYIPFNSTYSIEPRAALTHQFRRGEANVAIGIHSKPEHVSTYFLNRVVDDVSLELAANKDIEIPKSLHTVLGYKFPLNERTLLNTEVYFQYHFDVPVEGNDSSIFSAIMARHIWDMVGRDRLISQGTGRNYGIDISLQRALHQNYYYMLNTSIYTAEYSSFDGRWFNSPANGNYIVGFTGGKEWKLKNENKTLGINTKLLASGGNRLIPVDLEASLDSGEGVYLEDQAWTEKAGAYFRWDLGLVYKINRAHSTHSLMFDIQNVSGNQNVFNKFFNEDDLQVETVYQLGLFPFFNYRIEFQSK